MNLSGISTLTASHDAIVTLKLIQKAGFKSAILAGGAIRDMLFHQRVSDYDIFVTHPDMNVTVDGWQKSPDINEEFIYKMTGTDPNSKGFFDSDMCYEFSPAEDDDTGYSLNSHISAIWNIEKGLHDYQVVFVDVHPVEYLNESFDIGLCKAYCDGNKVRFTQDFMTDVDNKTLTICAANTKKHFDYILKTHLPRVKRKYSGYKVVVGPKVTQYVDGSNKHLI